MLECKVRESHASVTQGFIIILLFVTRLFFSPTQRAFPSKRSEWDGTSCQKTGVVDFLMQSRCFYAYIFIRSPKKTETP